MLTVTKTTHQLARKKAANRGQILQDQTPWETATDKVDL